MTLEKVRRSVWIDPHALLLFQAKGLKLSPFVNNVIAMFLDLPPDPRERILKEKSDEVVLRLRSSYEHELRLRIREYEQQQQVQDLDRAAADKRSAELLHVGELLQRTTCWSQVQRALQDQDSDSEYWEIAVHEVNGMDGDRWDSTRLWNTAIDWYARYGKGQHA